MSTNHDDAARQPTKSQERRVAASFDEQIASQAAEIERLKREVERLERDLARFFDGIMEQVDAVTEPELDRDVRNLDGYISVWQRQKKQIAQLESELAALRVEVANHFCDVRKIREWLPTHKPAVMSFTSGPEREVADYIEQVRFEAKVAKEP